MAALSVQQGIRAGQASQAVRRLHRIEADLEIEQVVLGGAMLCHGDWGGIAEFIVAALEPRDFRIGLHRHIFAAIQRLVSDREPVDILSVPRTVEALFDVSARVYIASLPNAVPAPASVTWCVQRMTDRRRAQETPLAPGVARAS